MISPQIIVQGAYNGNDTPDSDEKDSNKFKWVQ